jgi:hypothetical protein
MPFQFSPPVQVINKTYWDRFFWYCLQWIVIVSVVTVNPEWNYALPNTFIRVPGVLFDFLDQDEDLWKYLHDKEGKTCMNYLCNQGLIKVELLGKRKQLYLSRSFEVPMEWVSPNFTRPTKKSSKPFWENFNLPEILEVNNNNQQDIDPNVDSDSSDDEHASRNNVESRKYQKTMDNGGYIHNPVKPSYFGGKKQRDPEWRSIRIMNKEELEEYTIKLKF